jgi:hypothetical protein
LGLSLATGFGASVFGFSDPGRSRFGRSRLGRSGAAEAGFSVFFFELPGICGLGGLDGLSIPVGLADLSKLGLEATFLFAGAVVLGFGVCVFDLVGPGGLPAQLSSAKTPGRTLTNGLFSLPLATEEDSCADMVCTGVLPTWDNNPISTALSANSLACMARPSL